ncbi:hypothetical protein PMI04_011825 [Sphingobium sp. AP49]|uniref:hypothetical protein n=1 Tax=Sphingobium sp. AP49 TaxID=1144307 RepID=UPI0005654D21|nr:hypothetical protein [Sphingobium sp. AP49]WHO37260.1 hypothetical protein PMI04_011825 [Sphingobium sp. AP49]
MTTSERLGHTLVAIPVAHILGSALFLWSYCLGFGANIVVYASASDLFSVSISDMVRVYVLSLLFPLVITLTRLTSATPYAVDMANALPLDQQAGAHATNRKMRKFLNWIAIAIFLIFGGRALYEYLSDEQFPYPTIWVAFQVPVLIAWMVLCEKREFGNWTFESGALLGGFVLSLFCIGATKGQSDRFLPYADALTTHTTCSKSVVLRQISSKYLAILPDGSRVLISEDCKVVFRVPKPRGRPLYENPEPAAKRQPTKAVEGKEPSTKATLKPLTNEK